MIGKLNMYVEPGTVMGPNTTREFVTAFEHICEPTDVGPDCQTTFRHTQTKDLQAIHEPRSVTEHSMIAPVASPFGMIRTMDPYEMPTRSAMPATLIISEGQNGR